MIAMLRQAAESARTAAHRLRRERWHRRRTSGNPRAGRGRPGHGVRRTQRLLPHLRHPPHHCRLEPADRALTGAQGCSCGSFPVPDRAGAGARVAGVQRGGVRVASAERRGVAVQREVRQVSPLPRVRTQASPADRRVARSPEKLVEQIVAAERATSDAFHAAEGAGGGRSPAAGRLPHAQHPASGDTAVRAALPKGLVRVVSKNVASRRAFRSMHALVPVESSTRTCPTADRAGRPGVARCLPTTAPRKRRFGVDWAYLAAINFVRDQHGRIRGTSVAGAQGPMQFLRSTWDIHGRGDINSPRDSILAAGRFLRANGFNRPGGPANALYRLQHSHGVRRSVSLLAELMPRPPRAGRGCYHWRRLPHLLPHPPPPRR